MKWADFPVITDTTLGQLVDDISGSLSNHGSRYCGKTGRQMELSETHVIVISSAETKNVNFVELPTDPQGFAAHPSFIGYFQGIPCFEKNDPMPWAYVYPEILMDMTTLERMDIE